MGDNTRNCTPQSSRHWENALSTEERGIGGGDGWVRISSYTEERGIGGGEGWVRISSYTEERGIVGGGGWVRISSYTGTVYSLWYLREPQTKWIVEVVKTAYQSSNQDIPERITAHELRALASSWAYNCHIALEDVLSVAFWRSSGLFQRNYLRDLTPIAGQWPHWVQ